MRLTLQHFHCSVMVDVLKAHAIGWQDLIPHLNSTLFCQTARIQPVNSQSDTKRWHQNTEEKKQHISHCIRAWFVFPWKLQTEWCSHNNVPLHAAAHIKSQHAAFFMLLSHYSLCVYWLRYVDAQVVFSSSADVESQAGLVVREMQVNRSTQCSIWAVHRDWSVRFLNHHPPMDQIHPKHANTHAEHHRYEPQTAWLGWWHSPCGFLISVANARHAAHALDDQSEASVTRQHLHSAAHADVLQTHAVHLH